MPDCYFCVCGKLHVFVLHVWKVQRSPSLLSIYYVVVVVCFRWQEKCQEKWQQIRREGKFFSRDNGMSSRCIGLRIEYACHVAKGTKEPVNSTTPTLVVLGNVPNLIATLNDWSRLVTWQHFQHSAFHRMAESTSRWVQSKPRLYLLIITYYPTTQYCRHTVL